MLKHFVMEYRDDSSKLLVEVYCPEKSASISLRLKGIHKMIVKVNYEAFKTPEECDAWMVQNGENPFEALPRVVLLLNWPRVIQWFTDQNISLDILYMWRTMFGQNDLPDQPPPRHTYRSHNGVDPGDSPEPDDERDPERDSSTWRKT